MFFVLHISTQLYKALYIFIPIESTETDKLIGARVVASEGGEVIQQLSMAIKYGITVTDLAEDLYPLGISQLY